VSNHEAMMGTALARWTLHT